MATRKRKPVKKSKVSIKKNRSYTTDPAEKIANGLPWNVHFLIDSDIALELIKERKEHPMGAEFGRIINSRLRQAYGLDQPTQQKAS